MTLLNLQNNQLKFFALLLGLLLASILHAGGDDQEENLDIYRLLTYPFSGEVIWGVHDTDIEERVTKRFGQPKSRLPNGQQEKVIAPKGTPNATIFEYADVVFTFAGNVGYPNKRIQSIKIKNDRVSMVHGIQIGKPRSILRITNLPDDVFASSLQERIIFNFTSYGSYEVDETIWESRIGCQLIVSFDHNDLINGLEWHYGTGH